MLKKTLVLGVALLFAASSVVLAAKASKGKLTKEMKVAIAKELRGKARTQKPFSNMKRVAQPNRQAAPKKTSHKGVGRAIGTIVYDTGTAVLSTNAPGYCVGNRFNTFNGSQPVVVSGSVSSVSFYHFGGAFSSFFISAFGPVSGTAAPLILSTLIPQAGPGFYNAPFAFNYTGASFQAGVYDGNSATTGTQVGIDTGTVGGQGGHLMAIVWNTGGGTGFTVSPFANSVFRATGDLVPVELMDFSVE